jgi:hypothetical protein
VFEATGDRRPGEKIRRASHAPPGKVIECMPVSLFMRNSHVQFGA